MSSSARRNPTHALLLVGLAGLGTAIGFLGPGWGTALSGAVALAVAAVLSPMFPLAVAVFLSAGVPAWMSVIPASGAVSVTWVRLLGLPLMAWALLRLPGVSLSRTQRKVLLAAGVLAAAAAASLVASPTAVSRLGWIGIFDELILGVFFLLPLAVLVRRSGDVTMLLLALAAGTSVAGAWAIAEQVLRTNFLVPEGASFVSEGVFRSSGPFLHPIVLGAFLSISLVLLLAASRAVSGRSRLLLLVASAVGGLGLLSSNSRGPLSACLAGLLAMYAASPVNLTARLRRLATTALSAAVLVAVAVSFVGEGLFSRLGSAYTALARLQLYGLAWRAFLENPLFGVGYKQFSTVASGKVVMLGASPVWAAVDNYYLKVLAEMGIVGALAFGSVIVVVVGLVRVSRIADGQEQRWLRAGAIGMLVAGATTALTADILAYPPIAYLLALALCLLWSVPSYEYERAERWIEPL